MQGLVFVVLKENPDDGTYIADVYSTLDGALARMRRELQDYQGAEPYADIRWNAGAMTGHWGWYDANSSWGCYVYARKVKDEQEVV